MGSSLPLYLNAFEAFRLGILHQSERQRRFRRNAAYIFLRLYFSPILPSGCIFHIRLAGVPEKAHFSARGG